MTCANALETLDGDFRGQSLQISPASQLQDQSPACQIPK